MAKVLVIGKGALGSAVGAELLARGHAVGFFGRNGAVEHVFSLVPAPGQAAVTVRCAAPDAAFLAGTELVFVAVKAYDLAAALRHTAQVAKAAPVAAIGNGSVEAVVAARAAEEPQRAFRLGSATIGVSSERGGDDETPAYAIRSTSGTVVLGPFAGPNSQPTALEAQLTKDDAVFQWQANVLQAHRRKWLYNTVINSLCAARNLPTNGDLLQRKAELEQTFTEAHALGVELWGAWRETQDDLFAGMLSLIAATRANENSMARDVRLGLRTESEFLAGLAVGREGHLRLKALHGWISSRNH